ncbi:MAG: glutamate synthase subunit beta [Lentisphaeria bacterium]
MGKPTGFMEYNRVDSPKRPVKERIEDYGEIEGFLPNEELQEQGARCMECGIPFCHAYGCPVENLIPDWNDMVYRGQWKRALELLHSTNNMPEITGRICPAPCEPACTLSINQPAVTIRQIEKQIIERGWQEGWVKPEPPKRLTGLKCAVVGSGPAGLAAAQQLTRAGHKTSVFEKADRIGGILRYGIPDFKLDKRVLDRRLEQMAAEGTVFEPKVEIGEDISIKHLLRTNDAVLLAGGATVPRDLPVPGRELKGIHFAMEFLVQQNLRNAGDNIPDKDAILATDKDILIIGGGDTGSDCIGTSIRQKARSITQIEIMPRPPDERDSSTPWPQWPYQLRSSSSHEEGCDREWCVLTKEFLADDHGNVKGASVVNIQWRKDGKSGRMVFDELADTERVIPADRIFLAMGFTREGNAGIMNEFGVETSDEMCPLLDDNYMSNRHGIFVAGDLSKGASLVVKAIADGRRAAEGMNNWLANRKSE